MQRDHLLLYVNGRRTALWGRDAFQTVARFLRERGATGTKIVCEEGDCGACTVLIGRPVEGGLVYRPVNSCIQFLFQLDGTHLVSVEGLARKGELTPVQEAMIAAQGAQCGYCTPGFIVAMTAVAAEGKELTSDGLRCGLTGNLCRCTGYEPILAAGTSIDRQSLVPLRSLYDEPTIASDLETHRSEPVDLTEGERRFFRPVSLDDAVRIRRDHPGTVIVQGGTDFGVRCTKRGFEPASVMSLDAIEELREIHAENRHLVIGGAVSLTELDAVIRETIPSMDEIMDRFGSPQIRNAGTLAGNIANASPIADTLPLLFVMEAMVVLTGVSGVRTVPISSFYCGYKQLDLRDDELISSVILPLPEEGDLIRLYKVSKRSHLDIASFTAGFRLRIDDGVIRSVRIAYGGVAPVVLRLPRTEEFLLGKPVRIDAFEAAGSIAREEISPISDVRGSREYRLQLAGNILRKLYWELAQAPLARSA